jgi:hypothetical protein
MGKNGPGMVKARSRRREPLDLRYAGRVKTRYLLIISLATALIILGASAVWFLMAVR